MGLHPLAGVIEKLRRSDEHIVTLYNAIVEYLNDSPYRFGVHRDLGNGKAGFTFDLVKEPPLRLATIVGDAVHNLRSALDQKNQELGLALPAQLSRP